MGQQQVIQSVLTLTNSGENLSKVRLLATNLMAILLVLLLEISGENQSRGKLLEPNSLVATCSDQALQ